jgi:uncharacterized membrane protein
MPWTPNKNKLFYKMKLLLGLALINVIYQYTDELTFSPVRIGRLFVSLFAPYWAGSIALDAQNTTPSLIQPRARIRLTVPSSVA